MPFPSLTIATTICVSDEMVLIDMDGYDDHKMTTGFVATVVILGWLSFVLAIGFNIIYYIVHPMAPQVSPKDKLKTYICGNLWDLEKRKCYPKVRKDSTDQSMTMKELV